MLHAPTKVFEVSLHSEGGGPWLVEQQRWTGRPASKAVYATAHAALCRNLPALKRPPTI
jgi:hypothetical protein